MDNIDKIIDEMSSTFKDESGTTVYYHWQIRELIESLTNKFYLTCNVTGNIIYCGDYIKLDAREIGGNVIEGKIVFNNDSTLSRYEYGLWTKQGYYSTDFLGHITKLK